MSSVKQESISENDRRILRALEGRILYRSNRLHGGRVMYWITPDDRHLVDSKDVYRLLHAGLITSIDPQQIVLSRAGKAQLGYRDLISEFFQQVPS